MSQPRSTQLRIEDFGDLSPEVQTLAARLFRQLNPALEGVNNALSSGLSVSDNLRGGYVTLTFSTPAVISATTPPFPMKVARPFRGGKLKFFGFGVGRNLTDPSAVFTDAMQAHATDDGETLTVRWISGLVASTKYELTFLVLGE